MYTQTLLDDGKGGVGIQEPRCRSLAYVSCKERGPGCEPACYICLLSSTCWESSSSSSPSSQNHTDFQISFYMNLMLSSCYTNLLLLTSQDFLSIIITWESVSRISLPRIHLTNTISLLHMDVPGGSVPDVFHRQRW